ncbi:hypothetical protein HKX48_003500 [Thoreauomyces humboldtii]|nr:hypothetical protein HKX48_003500 [Thoreauomyces humboldtii]
MSHRRRDPGDPGEAEDVCNDLGFIFKPAKVLKKSLGKGTTGKRKPAEPKESAAAAVPAPATTAPVRQPEPQAKKQQHPGVETVQATPHPAKRNVDRRKTTHPVGMIDPRVRALKPRVSVGQLRRPLGEWKEGNQDYTLEIPLTGDTPMIARNKNMRQTVGGGGVGRRRSSIGLRGKRTSTAHNGLCPQPHETIEPEDFYRHIDADLSDPNRMRQLLVWCAQRSLVDRSSETSKLDPALLAILREVQNDVIVGLTSKQINTSWYHRPAESSELAGSPVKKLPHPQNAINAQKLVTLKAELERLELEEAQWKELLEEYTLRHPATDEPDNLDEDGLKHGLSEAELTSSDLAILERLQPGAYAQELSNWMTEAFENLQVDVNIMLFQMVFGTRLISELRTNQVDSTLDTLERVQAFEYGTRKFADGVFEKVLKAYEEKEKLVKPVDPMDVLRLLSVAKPLT